MYSFKTVGASLLALASISNALVARDGYSKDSSSSCTNSASDRQCWSDGFSVSTDYTTEFPDTGNVVTVSASHGSLRWHNVANMHRSTSLRLPGRPCLQTEPLVR